MAVLQDPSNPAYLAGVDANGNLKVVTPQDPALAGSIRLFDSGGDALHASENGDLQVSLATMAFFEQVDGSSVDTNKWAQSSSNMTIAQASGFITLNSGAALTAGGYAILNSIKAIPLYGPMPAVVQFSAKVSAQPQANMTMELGVGAASTTSAPTDGAFFRWTASGAFVCVVSNGGSETTSAPIVDIPASNVKTLFQITVVEDTVEFRINDDHVIDVDNPGALSFPVNAGHQTLFARVYNGGSSPNQAPQLSIGQVVVAQQGINQNKPWVDVLASLGRSFYQNPSTFGQTTNHANSTSPVSAALSNTAAGYTTLGGRYQFAAPAAAATDFALFAFQVPAMFQFVCTGIMISAMNTGAAVGASATVLDWAVGINASAVSLATADAAGVWAPRRVPLGMQSFAGLGVIGLAAPDISRNFISAPLVVDAGRYLHVIVQVPVGLATGSQVIRGDVIVTGYFE